MARAGYQVLIDGYNVIKRHPAWRRLPLLQARQQFTNTLRWTRWPVPVSRIDLIFDSRQWSPTPPWRGGPMAGSTDASPPVAGIRVIFAAPAADAVMQQTIRESADPGHLIVISDDREILDTAKAHGALRYSTTWLLEHSQPQRPPPPLRGTERAPLPSKETRQINAELRRHWDLKGGC